jgi:hypothetical protein
MSWSKIVIFYCFLFSCFVPLLLFLFWHWCWAPFLLLPLSVFMLFRNSFCIIPMIFMSSAYFVSMWACWPTWRWGAHCSCQRGGFACRWKIWSCSWEWYLCLSYAQFYDNGKIRGSKEDSRFQVVNSLCWYSSSPVLSGGMRSCCCALLLVILT